MTFTRRVAIPRKAACGLKEESEERGPVKKGNVAAGEEGDGVNWGEERKGGSGARVRETARHAESPQYSL